MHNKVKKLNRRMKRMRQELQDLQELVEAQQTMLADMQIWAGESLAWNADFHRSTRTSVFLSPLITNYAYLPLTNWAAGPQYYSHILNDIVINRKQHIVDIGSGISTILIGRLIRTNGLSASIISIDHNARWQEVVRTTMQQDGTDHLVQFLCAEIVGTEQGRWYDKEKIVFPENHTIDTLIVDGPIGCSAPLARLEAVPFLKDRLDPGCCTVYLHDTDRPDEQEILRRWAELLPGASLSRYNRYAVFSMGTTLTCTPQNIL